MPRLLSSTATAAINAQETGEVFLHLITIDHPTLADPIRYVDNTQDITRNGDVYHAAAFLLSLPEERDDAMPTAEIQIDNVDRAVIEVLRPLIEPPTITLEVILASAPNATAEAGPFNYTLRSVDYDALTIKGTLAHEDILNEPAMQYSFTPALFPGLFPVLLGFLIWGTSL